MKFITVALLALIVTVNGYARLRHLRETDVPSDAEQWQKHIDEFAAASTKPEELKEKVSEYYSKLTEGQDEFVKYFRKQCTSWIKSVASDEEKAELRALYEKKEAEVLAGKVDDYINRLSDNERSPVLLWKSACAYLWNIDIPAENVNARVRRSTTSHNILSTEWLTADQSAQIQGLKGDAFDKKYLEFFKALTGDDKSFAAKKITKKCYGWLEEVASKEERDELKTLHHDNHEKCKEKVREYLNRMPAAEKAHIEEHLDVCEEVWYAHHGHGHEHHHRRRRNHHHSHTFDEFAKEHLQWLTDDQRTEVMKIKDDKLAVKSKISGFFEATTGETRERALNSMKGACRQLLKHVLGDEKAEEMRTLKESGATPEALKTKFEEFLGGVTDEELKKEADEHKEDCMKLFLASSRRRRDDAKFDEGEFEDFANRHLSWMSADQKAEVMKLKGDKAALKAKLHDFFAQTTGETREKAMAGMKGACREMIKQVLGDDKANELKALKESGASPDTIKSKAEEFLSAVTDEKLKQKGAEYKEDCLKILSAPSRRRRDHHHGHKLEDYLKTHLSWLTPEQGETLKQLKADGKDATELQKKVFEFYEATTGETKEKATQLLQAGCRDLIKNIVGEDKAGELKNLKESGASDTEIGDKIKELIGGLTDPKKKEMAVNYEGACKRVFGVSASRKRRTHDHGAHKLEDYFKTHFSWLSDDQKETLRQMKADGKKEEIFSKALEFFEAATGETKEKATELMQGGCRELIRVVIGNEKADELTKMKESGTSVKDLDSKLTEFIGGVTHEEKKKLAGTYGPGCRKIFGVESRRRRSHDHGEHKLEDYFKTHFSWLSDEQKDELRQMKVDGKKEQIFNKALEFFEAATGETKEKATELMQGGCRELIRVVIGNEKADELTKMKESGTSVKDLDTKLQEFIGGVTDENKKKMANDYGPGCRKIFGVASRKRRDHHHGHKVEDYLKTHLSWLTPEQGETIKQMKADGKSSEEMQKKVFEFYDATTGESRAKATELLQAGCRDLLKSVVGEDKAAELKRMKESGASNDEMSAKIKELVGEVSDPHKQELAGKYEGACKRVFGVSSRRRRDHHHHADENIEEFAKHHLTWLTPEQKEQLMDLKDSGKDVIKNKVDEFYKATTGETREKATLELQNACSELINTVIGEDRAAIIKGLRESGANIGEIQKKIDEFLAQVSDEKKRQLAEDHREGCAKIFFASPTRLRRDKHHEHTLKEFVDNHLGWMNAEQKAEILELDGQKEAVKAKISEFFEKTSGDERSKAIEGFQAACRERLVHIVGDEKAAELKSLRESGASNAELEKKTEELLAAVEDETLKKEADEHKEECMKIFGIKNRMRREHKLEDHLKTHLSWLSEEQKEALIQLKAHKKHPKEIQEKVFEFYEATSGEERKKATELLQGGCRSLLQDIVGDEKTAELKKLKESGASDNEISSKIKDFMDEITDSTKKGLAVAYEGPCKRIFGVSQRRRRDHHHGHKLEDYLKTHLSWLTPEQGETLKQLKADGKDATELQKKVFEFYEATTGETKEKATQLLQAGCRDLIKNIVGEDKAGELKNLKESGASDTEIGDKIKELIGGLTDPKKKEMAVNYEGACKRVFGVTASRKRRHEGKHGIEDFLQHHLTWLTPDQKAEVEKLKDDKAALKAKVNGFFEAATGETKTKATEDLQGACRELYTEILEEKAAEVKTLKESGATMEQLSNKIDELLAEVTDPEKKAKADEYKHDCKKIFGVASRKRRDHHHGHKVEDYLKTHLSWLTPEQGETIKQMKADGKSSEEMQKKVFDFYDATTGESRAKATELLQAGCRDLLKSVVGEDKAAELKRMKESGASNDEMSAKIKELVGEVSDPHKQELAGKYEGACKRVFGVSSRRRRDHHHGEHKLEDYFKNHFSWLSDEQKDELRQMKADGKKEQIFNKALEFLEAATGETKEKATELMQGGCRELIRVVIGNEKADELTKMKESGTSVKDLDSKLTEFIGGVTDEEKKKLAGTYGPGCRKIFGVSSRRRRDHHHGEHKLEDYFKTHFSWLSDEQKDELRQMKTDGKTPAEIQAKVLGFFDAATGETKEKATELMQGGCRELIRVVIGNEKADELSLLKESGASIKALDSKLHEFLRDVSDERKKQLSDTYGPGCRKIFGVPSEASERKRRAFRPTITHIDFMRAVVKNEDKPQISHRALSYEIMDIYDVEKLSEKARMVVNQCHSLFGEIVQINPYKNENSVRELLHSLRSASDRQLKAIQAVAEICRKTVRELEKTEGRHGSIGATLIQMLDDLDDEPRSRLKTQWRSKCSDWILDVTDEEEREDLEYLLRTQRVEVLRERITELLTRFDDKTRTQIGHMRPVCESLLGITHPARKSIHHRKVPMETVF